MRKIVIIMISTILVLFSSCAKSPNTESLPPNQDRLSKDGWQMYKGELPFADCSTLSKLDCISDANGSYHIWGNTYVPVDIPEGKKEQSTTSGWRIELNAFCPVGVVQNNYIVFSPDIQSPLVLLLREGVTGEIQCFFREDVLIGFPNAVFSEEYDLYIGNERVSCDEELACAWYAHVSDSSTERGFFVLDGTWDFCKVNLIHKDCPCLCYEFKYVIIDGDIYVDNIYINDLVVSTYQQ